MSLAQRYQKVITRINDACEERRQFEHPVTLLAVSKTHKINKIRELYELGQRDFGENYAQEAIEKIEELIDLDINWHYIGPIQSNKTAGIASHFHWVQTVERLKIARRLNDQRPKNLPPLNVCIQVNISGEENKSGVEPSEVADLASEIAGFEHLKLRGLMCIPEATDDQERLALQLRKMRELYEKLKDQYSFDTLSMGMSGDLALAIAEGSTMVRIGTDIFGPRNS